MATFVTSKDDWAKFLGTKANLDEKTLEKITALEEVDMVKGVVRMED